MVTHLERLQRDLAILEAQPDGKDSKFAQGLKGQIAAAKFQEEQMATSTLPDPEPGMVQARSAYEKQARELAMAAGKRQGPSYREPLKYQLWNLMIMENFQAQRDNAPMPWPQAPASGADIAACLMGPDAEIRKTPLLSTLELARRETGNPVLTVEEFLGL